MNPPFSKDICIISPLTSDIVQRNLERVTDKPDYNHFSRLFTGLPEYPSFFGEVRNDGFKILPVSNAFSFTPLVTGNIEPGTNGSRIYVKVRFPDAAYIVTLKACLFTVVAYYTKYHRDPSILIISIFLILLGVFIFKRQTFKIRKKLFEVTGGKEELNLSK